MFPSYSSSYHPGSIRLKCWANCISFHSQDCRAIGWRVVCERKYSYSFSGCPVQILHSDPVCILTLLVPTTFTVRSLHWTTCVGKGHSLVSNAITDCFPKIIYIYIYTHTQLYIICVLSHFSHVQLFLKLMDCSLPGFSVHGILQARMEWVAMPSSRETSWPKDRTHICNVSCIGRRVLYD